MVANIILILNEPGAVVARYMFRVEMTFTMTFITLTAQCVTKAFSPMVAFERCRP